MCRLLQFQGRVGKDVIYAEAHAERMTRIMSWIKRQHMLSWEENFDEHKDFVALLNRVRGRRAGIASAAGAAGAAGAMEM